MVACTRAMTFWTEKLNTPAGVPSLGGFACVQSARIPRESPNPCVLGRAGRANPRDSSAQRGHATRQPRFAYAPATAAVRACQFQGRARSAGTAFKVRYYKGIRSSCAHFACPNG